MTMSREYTIFPACIDDGLQRTIGVTYNSTVFLQMLRGSPVLNVNLNFPCTCGTLTAHMWCLAAALQAIFRSLEVYVMYIP
jgi:hypothetical protein